jgi:hypothetical protein
MRGGQPHPSTARYGDIMPQTTYEHLVCIALFITSAIIFAYVMGHVSVLSEQLHVSDALCAIRPTRTPVRQ